MPSHRGRAGRICRRYAARCRGSSHPARCSRNCAKGDSAPCGCRDCANVCSAVQASLALSHCGNTRSSPRTVADPPLGHCRWFPSRLFRHCGMRPPGSYEFTNTVRFSSQVTAFKAVRPDTVRFVSIREPNRRLFQKSCSISTATLAILYSTNKLFFVFVPASAIMRTR